MLSFCFWSVVNLSSGSRVGRTKLFDKLWMCVGIAQFGNVLGLVYLEAMSVSTPVIGVKGQGIEDFIVNGENGYLMDAEDTGQLYSLIQKLMNDGNLRVRIGKNGFETYRNSLANVRNNAAYHFKLYERFLNE